MNRPVFVLTAALFICARVPDLGAGIPGAVQTLTFQEALRVASEKNPAVMMADERVRQAAERFHQARSYLFPQVTLGSSWMRQTKNLETFGIPLPGASSSPVTSPFNVFDARAEITETLFDLSMIQRLDLARLGKELSVLEEEKIKEDSLVLAGTLYIEARRSQDAVNFSKVLLRLAWKKYLLAQGRRETGTLSEQDRQEAGAELSKSRAQWRQAKTRAQSALLDLKAALGLPAQEPLRLMDGGIPQRTAMPRPSELAKLVAAHPDTAVAEKSVRQREAERIVESSDIFPRLSVSADTGVNGNDPENSKDTYSYGAKISWPIFESGRREARVAEAQSKVQESRIRLEDTRRGKEIVAVRAKGSLKDALAMLKATEDRLSHRSEKVRSVQARFENGSASKIELMEAAAERTKAADEREEAVAALRTAEIGLAHALGRMQTLL